MPHTPTPEQQAIIDHLVKKPEVSLMVDARAGAAKTSTIEMAAGSMPSTMSTLAVAFNKRIAEELSLRLPAHFTCKTLNAVGHGAWGRRLGKRLILDADKLYKDLKLLMGTSKRSDEDDTFAAVLSLARRAKSAGLVPEGAPMRVQGIVNDHRDNWENFGFEMGMSVDFETIDMARQLLLRSITASFQGTIDFDDQIYMSVLFGGQYEKFHTVIVDEAQDLSPLNHLQLCKMAHVRLVAVGDPYQAIYAFRGADSNSMTNLADEWEIHSGKRMEKLGLTQSFRVPKGISARHVSHVPDFGSMDFLPEGTIEVWPLTVRTPNGIVVELSTTSNTWSLSAIPSDGFVLCRNNAPLVKLAFAIIKQRRPVKILGREIGQALANVLIKACGKAGLPTDAAYTKLRELRSKEIAKAGDSLSKIDTINDRFECLQILLDASGCDDSNSAAQFIKDLFSDKENGGITLATGHKAKGLEKPWVMHLDPHRCPSPQAERAASRGNMAPMLQELNLKYVIETRSQGTLVLARLEDCEEIGGDDQ